MKCRFTYPPVVWSGRATSASRQWNSARWFFQAPAPGAALRRRNGRMEGRGAGAFLPVLFAAVVDKLACVCTSASWRSRTSLAARPRMDLALRRQPCLNTWAARPSERSRAVRQLCARETTTTFPAPLFNSILQRLSIPPRGPFTSENCTLMRRTHMARRERQTVRVQWTTRAAGWSGGGAAQKQSARQHLLWVSTMAPE